jgi:hypothetical protein
VLPLLVALLYRAAIPAGVMPMIGADGSLVLELCTGVATGPSMPGHDHHAHHDHQHGHDKSGAHSLCPFAAAVGASPLPVTAIPPAAAPATFFIAASAPDSISPPTILRSQQSRAPPPGVLA